MYFIENLFMLRNFYFLKLNTKMTQIQIIQNLYTNTTQKDMRYFIFISYMVYDTNEKKTNTKKYEKVTKSI